MNKALAANLRLEFFYCGKSSKGTNTLPAKKRILFLLSNLLRFVTARELLSPLLFSLRENRS